MNLEKNQLWTLWFGLGLFIAAFIWDGAFSLGNNTERYRNLLEKNLHQQERDAEAVLSDNAFVERRLTDKFTGTDFKADTARLDKLRDKPFNICFFKNDSLVFWTKNDVLPTKTDFGDDTIIGKTHTRLVEIQGSQFELRSRRSARPDGSRLTVAALIPIRRNYNSFEGKFLENRFIASTLISSELSLMPTDATHVQMLTYEGHALCSLQFKKNTDSIHDIGMLCLLVAGFLMLGFFGDRLAKQMLNEYESPMLGVSFFIGTLVVLRGCIWHIESSQFFPTTDLNTNDFQNATFMHSISALFINSVFLFWLAIFFNKEFRLPDFKQHPLWARGILAVGLFSIAVILNILSIGIFNDIVATPTKEPALAFDNLNALNLRSTFTLCGLGLMQLSIFLITHRLIKSATELELTHWQQFFAVDIAIGLGAALYNIYELDAGLPVEVYAILLFLYLALFYIFVNSKRAGIVWLMNWIIIFTAIQAFFVSRFNDEKEINNLSRYAFTLASTKDTIAEKNLLIMTRDMNQDRELHDISQYSFNNKDTQRISNRIREFYKNNEYLSNHYSFRFFGSKKTGEAVLQEDSIQMSAFFGAFENGRKVSALKNPNCRLSTDKDGNTVYLALLELPMQKDNSIQVAMQLSRSDRTNSRVFTEILADKHYKGLNHLNEYTYAIYKPNGDWREGNQKGVYQAHIAPSEMPSRGEYSKPVIEGNHIDLTYANTEGVVVHIGKTVPILSQGFTLWVYFMIVLLSVVGLLSAVNYFGNFLPEVIQFPLALSFNTSLSNRLIFPIVALFVGCFIAIFYFTDNYFEKLEQKYYNADFETKTTSIAQYAQQEFCDLAQSNSMLLNDAKWVTTRLIFYSTVHQTAMHFFNTEGSLFATTEDNIFDRGFLSRQMNPTALMRMKTGVKVYTSDEKFGTFPYRTKYYTVTDTLTKRVLGYLELPFYSRDRSIRTGAIDLWNYILPVLMLLFIICASFIYYQTQKNLSPIQEVAAKLRRFRFANQAKNELIEWDKKDEIGDLIGAYNDKVNELDDALIRLAETERETAWREMARQVAHEIRNPLTPMKLAVQHVEYLQQNGSDAAEQYALRSNKLLLEQIMTIEKIVNEFHQFARMPQKATNYNFCLNDLVKNVADLFAQPHDGGRLIDVTLSLPTERFIVYADRTLLTGAFNNLVKNAIQAIPSNRDGRVRISLYREAQTAIVKISDNGVGIPLDIQDKIFGANFTTRAYGSGIGLLVTKNIIQSVNGRVFFETVENEGTDFFVELDIEDIEISGAPAESIPMPAPSVSRQ